MDVLVISGGSSRTQFDGTGITCPEVDETPREALVSAHPDQSAPAADLFRGREHQHVSRAVEGLRDVARVDWRILSPGFGLVAADTPIVATECSFSDIDVLRSRAAALGLSPGSMTHAEVRRAVGETLGIPGAINSQLDMGYDLAVVVLASNYLEVLAPGLGEIPVDTTAIAIAAAGAAGDIGACHWLPATDAERALLESDWVALRGHLFERLVDGLEAEADLEAIAADPELAYFRSLGLR